MIQRWVGHLALIFGGIFFALVLTEGGLRLARVTYPNFYQLDDDLGVALRPGASGWWRKEGGDFIRINSDGMRDREHSKRKPLNTFRIAILGDSMAESLQVPIRATF